MSAGTRVPDDWFAGFHEGLVARFWRAAGEAMADDDARLVLALLGERPLRVLDVPCGNGRIARRLAAAGHEVAGIDIAPEEVALARAAAPDVRFEVGDLRALPDLGAFDAVVSWGNSFGYLRPARVRGVAGRDARGAAARRPADPRVADRRGVVPPARRSASARSTSTAASA